MKHWPMAVKIWTVFAAVILCLFLAVSLLMPSMLRSFFTGQIYGMIKDSQKLFAGFTVSEEDGSLAITISADGNEKKSFLTVSIAKRPKLEVGTNSDISAPATPSLGRTTIVHRGADINHLFFYKDKLIPVVGGIELPDSFIQKLKLEMASQKNPSETYEGEISGQKILYIIQKSEDRQSGSLISYTWNNYREEQIGTLFRNLSLLLIALMLVSWLPCMWLARYLSKPFSVMEKQINRIAEHDWHEPFDMERKDEIGRLATAFETMRQRLVQQDQAQQSYLQNTSHELKTPVMVIHSYAQSIKDGFYPKGSIENSIETIISEAERLDKQIHSLLSLNRLQYIRSTSRQSTMKPMDIKEVLVDVVERLRYRRPELKWSVEMPVWFMNGNEEQWKVVFENIIDNQIRYASSEILISAQRSTTSRALTLEIYNDGPPMEESLLQDVFDPFKMGPHGRFGLGLAIVKQILNNIGAQIEIIHKNNGVAFRLTLPEEDAADVLGKDR